MITIRIKGTPYSKDKNRGRVSGLKEWSKSVIRQTRKVEKVDYPCHLSAEFILPQDKFPPNLPYGSDLDNLLKRLFDSLQKTFLKNDSLIVKLTATKRKAKKRECVGVIINIVSHNPRS